MSSWRDILVEWCNCLQLTPNIKDINELRGNDFFKNVLSILDTSNNSSKNGTFRQLLTIFNEAYPNTQTEDINCDSFMSLSEDRLIIITSLLMHYTCMYDKRDIFTLPLCQKLHKKSQLSIKEYLQSVNKEVTFSDLHKLIGQHRIQEYNESKPTQSPLTDVFRTPILKIKFEKDKAVNKLKNALELEQYQKADLQDDLEREIKKNQNLEKLLSKRNAEINSLKSEIFNLKCKTPPQQSKKLDAEHQMKLLKFELENFQEYISNNEKEHEQLREEHQLYKKKVEEYESAYIELTKKYLSYNEQIDNLTEMLQEKSLQVNHLEAHCKELSEILEGYKEERPVSADVSFNEFLSHNKINSSITNPENLASAVIEIQLKESQEMNVELKLKVNHLNSELISTKRYLDSKIEENRILQNRIKSISVNVEEFKQEFNDMKIFFGAESNQYKSSLSILQQDVNNVLSLHHTSLVGLNNQILALEKTIEKKEIEISELNEDNNKFISSIETLTDNNTKLQNIIEQNKLQISQLLSDKSVYVQDITNMTHENNILCAKSEDYRTKITALEEHIKLNEKKLTEFQSDKDQCISEIQDLNKQNSLLNAQLAEYCSTVKSYENKIILNEKELSRLHSQMGELCNNIEFLTQQNNVLNIKSGEYRVQQDELKNDIEQKENDLARVYSEKDKMNNEIGNLTKQNEILKTKSEEYFTKVELLEDEIKKKEKQLTEIISEKDKFKNETKTLSQQNGNLKTKLEELIIEVESLKNKIKQSTEDINGINCENNQLNNTIEILTKQNEVLNIKLQKCCVKVESLVDKNEKKEVELTELHSVKDKLNDEIEVLAQQTNMLNTKLDEYNAKISSLENLIEQKNKEITEIICEKENYSEEIEALKQQNNLLYINSNETCLEMKNVQGEIKSNKKLLTELSSQNTQYISDIETYRVEIDNLRDIIKKLESDLVVSDKSNKDYLNELNYSNAKNDEYLCKIESLNSLLEKNQTKLGDTNEKLDVSNSQFENLQRQHDEFRHQNNQLKFELTKAEELNEEITKKIKFLENELSVQKIRYCENEKSFEKIKDDEILVLQQTIDELNEKNSNYLHKLEEQKMKLTQFEQTIMNLKADAEDRCTIIQHTELNQKYENCLKQLDVYASFKKHIKQYVTDLEAFYKKEFYEYNNLVIELKDSINNFKNKLVVSEDSRKELQVQLNEWKESNSILLMDLENIKTEMDKINIKYAEDNKEKEKFMNENQELKEDFVSLTKTINMFNEELNKVVRSLKDRKNKSDYIFNNIHKVYKELNTGDLLKTPEKGHKTNDVSSEINKLGEKISKLNSYIDIFSEKETFYLKELETMKEELTASTNSQFDMIQNLKEQILDNEHQISEQTENLHSVVEKYNQLQSENQKNLVQIEGYKNELDKIKKTHADDLMLKETKIKNLLQKIHDLECETINLKKTHNGESEGNKEKLDILKNENSKNCEKLMQYETEIISLKTKNVILEEEVSNLKKKTNKTEEDYEMFLANLQVQVVRNKLEITDLKKKNEDLISENQNLSTQLEVLNKRCQESENRKIPYPLEQETSLNMQLKTDHSSALKGVEMCQFKENFNKCEEVRIPLKFLEEKNVELSQKIETLLRSSQVQRDTYETFKTYYRKFKKEFDEVLSQRNSLENLILNIRLQIMFLNKNVQSDNSIKLTEQRECLDIISDDVIKQYHRYSKQINDIVQEFVRYYENNCDNIFATLELKIEDFLEKHNIYELRNQISDLTDRAVDILEQTRNLQKEYENSGRLEEKENILTSSKKINVDKMKDDELKRKNVTLRQKNTLLENAKSNLEKTVKKLREENRKFKENDNKNVTLENDVHYKMLLQEYISYKENQEKVLKEYRSRIEDLQKEYQDHKDNCLRTSTPIASNFFLTSEKEKSMEEELENLKEAFSKLRISNEKFDNENVILKRIIGEQKEEMRKFISIKEAYDKLLEENNKLMTEVDTMKYKRARDRDEFLKWLKKEKNENTKQIQNIKAEYETKLEKMKEKMIKLYREEVNKEMSKIKGKQNESTSLLKTIERLECDLFEAKQRVQLLTEKENMKKYQEHSLYKVHSSNPQIHDLDGMFLKDFSSSCMNSTAIDNKPRSSIAKSMEFKHPSKVNPSSLDTRRQYDERQVRTLPRTGVIVEEVNIRRTSFGVPNSMGNLQMEDEDEMFNNKYLTDLEQGKCEAEDKDFRVSELAWRNSLVPPHLKSSYPAETQFCSPNRYREDDIKGASGPFDDSLCKLLPNEKRKKDFGTTSYKKPGPPTPSKNGGRLSLTGSETHANKDQHSESKKNTPGRIRSLFTGKSSSRNSIEPGTSPKKRLSIFRR